MAALQMSSQRSDWREQLHANPSRMEHDGGEADTSREIISYEEGVVAEAPSEGSVPALQQNPRLSGKLEEDSHRQGRNSVDISQ